MEKVFAAFPKGEALEENAAVGTDGFTQIFDSYYKRIYNYMRYRVSDPDEAEELTSQVFEQVLRKIRTFNPDRAPFEVWIFSIAHHAVNDYYRSKKRHAWFSLDSIRELISLKPGPEETALQNEDRDKLNAALESLQDRERNIIAMKFAGRLKNRDIAVLTGLSESNVGVILYRALRKLRDSLKKQGVRR